MSSLALSPAGPYFDVSAAGSLAGLTPFDVVFWPDANEEHVSLSAASAAFVRSEIAAGLVSVGPGGGGAGADGGRLALSVGPNPFSSSARVRFVMPRAGWASVCVYGVDGRLVRTLADGEFGAGAHEVVWDGRDGRDRRLAPAVYLIRVSSGGEAVVRRGALLD